jgi:N-carbamoyl-L-amino-acid hydrolase
LTATVDAQQLQRELDTLASFSEQPAPAVTRVVFGEMDLRARAYLKTLFADASLVVREDPVGNTFARWIGANPSLPPVATGSHCDAIPNAGRFDGTVGVLGGLEAIRALQRAGFTPQRSIDLIVFTSEEPTRFGIGCLGSRLLASGLDPSAGETLTSEAGRSTRFAHRQDSRDHCATSIARGAYTAFVELHIEQGPILDRDRIDVGVVTAIAAPASFRIFVEGEGGHAGAVLMPDRRDAFLAAAGDCAGDRTHRPVQRIDRHGGDDRRVRAVSGCDQQRPKPYASWTSTCVMSIRRGATGCFRTSRARATRSRRAAASPCAPSRSTPIRPHTARRR